MKVAPLHHALYNQHWCEPQIIHTGQHYDASMSEAFFRDLRLPAPTHHLSIGSGTHAEQTGRTMIAYEGLCVRSRPDAIVVAGDVNATAACAMVGAKLQVPVVHLEAGLRSRDRTMPEEINRLVTDAIADLLWTPSADADDNLRAEGVPPDRIECIGNVMIDSFEMLRNRIENTDASSRLGLNAVPYAVVTLHRPSNVDRQETLSRLIEVLAELADVLRVVFAIHPRTRKRLEEFGLLDAISKNPRIHATEPLGYVEFMSLIMGCALAVTDSGGVQEETTYLGIPCATLRENTERPITVTVGTNRLLKPAELVAYAHSVLENRQRVGRRPEKWDGHAAERAVASLRRFMGA